MEFRLRSPFVMSLAANARGDARRLDVSVSHLDKLSFTSGCASLVAVMLSAARASLVVLLVLSCVPGCCLADKPRVNPLPTSLWQSERDLREASAHAAEFTPTTRVLAEPSCESVQPPEALVTPDPLCLMSPMAIWCALALLSVPMEGCTARLCSTAVAPMKMPLCCGRYGPGVIVRRFAMACRPIPRFVYDSAFRNKRILLQ